MEQEIIKVKLHKFQDEAIFAKQRFIALVAGIQSGKTTGGVIWSRIQFDKNRKANGLIVAPTYKILTQGTLPKFFEVNRDLLKFYKKSDNIIEVPDCGKIFIRSTENPNVIESMTVDWIWADEAGQMPLQVWINMQGRVSINQGKIFITTTPYTLNWLYTDFYDKALKGLKDYKIVQYRSVDNPYFPKEEFERVKNEMDRRTFERRYCGMFTKMQGLVYDLPPQAIVDKRPDTFVKVIAGIDWGFKNPCAIVVIGQDKDGVFWIIDEFYQSNLITSDIIEKAKNLQARYVISRFYADSAEPDRIQEFQSSGLHCIGGEKDKVRGINTVRNMITEGRLKVLKTCKYTIDEFNTYHYPEGKDEKNEKEEPEPFNNHAMDAIKYALATYKPERQFTTPKRDYQPGNNLTGY